jgi:hypothetical protein
MPIPNGDITGGRGPGLFFPVLKALAFSALSRYCFSRDGKT